MSTSNDIFQAQKLTSSAKINQEISRVLSLLLRDFISSWYTTLTADKDLYVELTQSISILLQEIERRLMRVEWVGLLTHELPQIFKNHIQDYKRCCARVETAYSGGLSFDELFFGLQPHTALESPESEKLYLRRVSEILVDVLIPEHELQSDAVRLLLRELVCNNVLMVLMDVVSEPDFINEILLKELVPEIVLESPQSDISGSDMSETPYSDTESQSLTIPTSHPQPQPMISDSTLFRVKTEKEKSFLRRRRQKSDPLVGNAIAQGLNKLTFGGLERVSSGFDKLKDFVTPGVESLDRRRKKRETRRVEDLFVPTSESDADVESTSRQNISTYTVAPSPILAEAEPQTPLITKINTPLNDKMPMIIITGTNPTQKKPETISQLVKKAFNTVWSLHWESKNGPWKLGPINTPLYDRFHLEETILELLEEILELQQHHRWIYVQLQVFVKPVLYAVGGNIMNRAVLRGVHALISEEAIAKYVSLFRESFWPNDQPCPPDPIRSESEKARIRQLLEEAISMKIKGTFH